MKQDVPQLAWDSPTVGINCENIHNGCTYIYTTNDLSGQGGLQSQPFYLLTNILAFW